MNARDELLAACRALWERRLVSGSSGNVSLRLDDERILITPTRSSLGLVTAREFVELDLDGRVLGNSGAPSVEHPLHLAAYRARPDVHAVVHTHPTFCVVWAGRGRVFPRETVAARESLAEIGWVPYSPSGSRELAEATQAVLASGPPLALLGDHGLVAAFPTWHEAFVQTDLAEACAEVAFYASLN